MDELREAFEEAFDKAEAEAAESEAEDIQEETDDSVPESEGEEQEDAQDNENAEAEGERETPNEKPDEKTEQKTAPVKSKVPASWGASAKETWGKVPEAAQKQILKREAEVNTVLQQSATARKAAESLNRTLEPYKSGLIASGVQDPFQAIDVLLRTEATLRGGTQVEKGRMVAQLIKDYGVDIGTLDSLLSGEAPAPEADRFEQMLNAKLAPVNQFLAQQQQNAQAEQYSIQANAAQSIQEFSQNAEFLSDVRNDMADLLDMAAARGQEMSLEEAYQKACLLHPEVSKVMAAREKEQRIMGSTQEAQKKKAAAASLTGKQGGAGGGGNANMSLHDQIAAAWDSQVGG